MLTGFLRSVVCFVCCLIFVSLKRYQFCYSTFCGPGSSVGIATDYGLDGPGSNPGGDEIFPPVQTGPGAHPSSCTMGTGSFPGVEAAGTWVWPPTPSSAEVLERVELYLYSP